MKIDLQSNLPVYRKNAGKENPVATVSDTPSERRDVVDINHGSIGADKQMVSLKASVHNRVNSPTDPQRIAQLQAQVREGSYHIPTNEIANAMLGIR